MGTNKHSKPGRPALYPWKRWLKPGKTTKLEKGIHFWCETQSMVLLARRHLRKKKLVAHISVRGLVVTVSVEKKELCPTSTDTI